MTPRLAVRWTIGDVSSRGFDALALSIHSAVSLFGDDATYAVTVNSIETGEARARTGSAAALAEWHRADDRTPAWLKPYLDSAYAEGVAWKFAPVRLFPNCYELSLDNDVILWKIPPSVHAWMEDRESCLVAEDVAACFGKFADLCGSKPRNSGIRGFPPGFDYEDELRRLLVSRNLVLTSELDEQGLQVAAIVRNPHHVVRVQDVTICGPFAPHVPRLGRCGAHFVGVNAKKLPWEYLGRSGELYVHENWDCHVPVVRERLTAMRNDKAVTNKVALRSTDRNCQSCGD